MRTGCGASGPALPVHRLFAGIAAASPDAVAVICEQDYLTYAALDREANRLAFLLHRLGVGRTGVVAFLLPRSVEAIVAMLAVLKVGGTFVPLDPGYPPAQLADIVADCAPVCVLADAGLMATFGPKPPWHAPTFIMADALRDAEAPALPPQVEVDPEDAAYIMYTSGSTGRPKAFDSF